MRRQPVVAGQFYPGTRGQWEPMVREYLAKAEGKTQRTILAMAPHAGYVYSGAVAGKTLGSADLTRTVVMLGPNHTGQGAPVAVWPGGSWEVPGASVPVDEELARSIIDSRPEFEADTAAHLMEHSLEVMLPFLVALDANVRIVPVCVSERSPETLERLGQTLASVLRKQKEPVSIVVSSDMSHYVSHEQAQSRDALAIQAMLDMDPDGLYKIVRAKGITMCGVLPMTMGLVAAKELGASSAELVEYATSGEVSGDYGQVVGYAGVLVS